MNAKHHDRKTPYSNTTSFICAKGWGKTAMFSFVTQVLNSCICTQEASGDAGA